MGEEARPEVTERADDLDQRVRDTYDPDEPRSVAASGASAPALTLCPTHAVCPPCREGWGHWNGHEHVPTIQSEAAKVAVYVSHECYGDRHDDCAWPRCECGCHRGA